MANSILTHHNYIIVPKEEVQKKIIEYAPSFVNRIESYVKENSDFQTHAKFNSLLIKFLIKSIGNLFDFIDDNETNTNLTVNQRALLSNLYKLAINDQPSLPIKLCISLINEDRLSTSSPIGFRKLVQHSEHSFAGTTNDMWVNILRNIDLIDIVWVIKEIFDNRD